MELILAIESSGAGCSVALGHPGALRERHSAVPREHHARILPMVDELLSEAGLRPAAIDAIAFGRGPGSFTGVRIATSFAQGLGFALDRPLIPVSSLHALALEADALAGAGLAARGVLVAVDAHMGELFVARFGRDGTGLRPEGPEALDRVAEFRFPEQDGPAGSLLLAGDAWTTYPALLPPGFAPVSGAEPRARQVLRIAAAAGQGARLAPALAEPHYVRGVSAWKTKEAQGPRD